jgi:predicted N-acetyltransferase YhbS
MRHRFSIRPEAPADRPASDALVEAAFGPGRLAKTAERLREGQNDGPVIALVVEDQGRVAGVVRLWSVSIGETRALFLGPIAVDPTLRGSGLGRALVRAACERAAADDWPLVVLIGDPPWFGPLGFAASGLEQVTLPGPVDRRRLLARALIDGALEGLAGEIRSGG